MESPSASRFVLPGTLIRVFVALIFAIAAAGPARAQVQGVPVELDLQALLFDSRGEGFRDAVWQITPGPGRRVLLLPLVALPVDKDTELSRIPIGVRGGRLIGFHIPRQEGRFNTQGDAIDFARFTDHDPEAFRRLLFGSEDEHAEADEQQGSNENDAFTDDGQGFDAFGDPAGGLESDASPYGPVPTSAPRLARRVVLHADASVSWGLDRGFPSAEVASGGQDNLYPLKLDPARLREQEPPRAERITRRDGEDAREYAARRREAQQAQREKELAFRELRDSLRELPTEFRVPTPPVIYAVIEAPESDSLSIQGASDRPWTLSTTDRERIERLAQGGGRAAEDDRAYWSSLNSLLDDGHPLTQRAVALAAMRSASASSVEQGSPGFAFYARLLTVEDPVAQRIAVYAVSQSTPHTPATASLLQVAGQAAVGELREPLQVAAVRAIFSATIDQPERVGELVQQVNTAIDDPNGPRPDRIIAELLRSNDQMGRQGNTESSDRIAVVMINRVNFDMIGDDEIDAVIATIIRYAPSSRIAAGWLDIKLLRGADAERIDRTLALLDQAGPVSPLVRPLVASVRDLVLTPPKSGSDTSVGPITLTGTIPLDSSNHGLIRAFDSTDPERQAVAWQVLRHFQIGAVQSDIDAAPALDTPAQTFTLILNKALAETQISESLVAFIDRQRGPELDAIATQSMIRLLLESSADPAGSELVARKVLESDRDFREALRALPSASRLAFARALYAQLHDSQPLVIGLVAEQAGDYTQWFAEQIQTGRLPSERDWAQYAGSPERGGERRLIQAASSDENPTAIAAAAALVINAGGTTADQNRFATTVSRMETRTPERIEEAWSKVRLELFSQALARAEGAYQLVVTLDALAGDQGFDEFGDQTAEPGDAAGPVRVALGLIELEANGDSVAFSVSAIPVAVADDRLAIRLLRPASLRTFSNPDLADLPLSQMTQPIDLLPQDGGAWVGRATLPDGRSIEIALEPAR